MGNSGISSISHGGVIETWETVAYLASYGGRQALSLISLPCYHIAMEKINNFKPKGGHSPLTSLNMPLVGGNHSEELVRSAGSLHTVFFIRFTSLLEVDLSTDY